jgi:hypothetical protein
MAEATIAGRPAFPVGLPPAPKNVAAATRKPLFLFRLFGLFLLRNAARSV